MGCFAGSIAGGGGTPLSDSGAELEMPLHCTSSTQSPFLAEQSMRPSSVKTGISSFSAVTGMVLQQQLAGTSSPSLKLALCFFGGLLHAVDNAREARTIRIRNW